MFFIGIILFLFPLNGENSLPTIRNAADAFIRSQLSVELRESAVIEFRSVPASEASFSKFRFENQTKELKGNVSIPVEMISAEGRVQRGLVSVRVRTFGSAAVAVHQCERQEAITADFLTMQYRELTALPSDVIRTPDEIAGMRSKKIINAGSVLRKGYFEQIPPVCQNDQLDLVVRRGNVILRSRATAKNDGLLGKTVTIQRNGSHERIEATVIGVRLVEIAVQ